MNYYLLTFVATAVVYTRQQVVAEGGRERASERREDNKFMTWSHHHKLKLADDPFPPLTLLCSALTTKPNKCVVDEREREQCGAGKCINSILTFLIVSFINCLEFVILFSFTCQLLSGLCELLDCLTYFSTARAICFWVVHIVSCICCSLLTLCVFL